MFRSLHNKIVCIPVETVSDLLWNAKKREQKKNNLNVKELIDTP